MYIVLSINNNFTGDLRNAPASLRPHWEHFEIDSFSLLFLATTDLEFIYFSFIHCETSKTEA